MTRRVNASLIGLALLAVGASCNHASSTSSTVAGSACVLQPQPGIGGRQGDILSAIDGSTPDGTWVVGTHFAGVVQTPVASRWTGADWTTGPLKVARMSANRLHLEDVSVVDPSDVWAVGFQSVDAEAIHWDGDSWTAFPTHPVPGGTDTDLIGVSATGPRSAWAVGQVVVGHTLRALIQRWDGTGWSLAATPPIAGGSSTLKSVDTGAGGSAWAAGWRTVDGRYLPLVLRLQDGRWRIVPVPPGAGDSILSSVSVGGPSNVWVAGWSLVGDRTTSQLLHWDGSAWSRTALPGSNGARARLAHVAIVPGGVAVVGQAPDATAILRPVAFSRAPSGWRELGVGAGDIEGGLVGVTAPRSGGLMAAGEARATQSYQTLVVRGC